MRSFREFVRKWLPAAEPKILGNKSKSRRRQARPTVELLEDRLAPAGDFSLSAGSTASDVARAVAIDTAGNVYVTGNFSGTVDFDPVGTAELTSSSGNNVFVAKYSATGSFEWAEVIAGDQGNGITVNGSGEVFVTGTTGADAFVAKLNSNGIVAWTSVITHVGMDDDIVANSIAFDSGGNVFVAGAIKGSATFGGLGDLTSSGTHDVFIAKFDDQGAFAAKQKFGGTGVDRGYGIAVDGSGVYVTGYFEVGATAGSDDLVNAGSTDAFVVKLDSNLSSFSWANRLGGGDVDVGFGISLGSSGSIYVTGKFKGTATINVDNTNSLDDIGSNNGSTDIFVAKYDLSGGFEWARPLGDVSDEEGLAIDVDADDNVYVTGFIAASSLDVFLGKLSSAGDVLSSDQFGGTSNDLGYGIAVSGAGDVHVVGSFQSSNFDPGFGSTLASNGSNDVFIVKYGVAAPNQSPIAHTGGPYIIDNGVGLTLNASDSSDPDGNITTYEWDIGSDGSYEFTTSSPTLFKSYAQLVADGLQIGSNPLTLRVTDNSNATHTAATTITVNSTTTPTVSLPSAGGAFQLRFSSGDILLEQGGNTLLQLASGSVSSLTINGSSAGNDTLTIDFAGGNPIPAGGVSFNGGVGGNDSLILTGYSLLDADGVADVSVTHTSSDSGNIVLAGLGTVTFDEIEPLTLAGNAADLVITLPAGADSITLGDDGGTQDTNGNTANTSALYDSTGPTYSFEFTEFTNPTNSLTIVRGSAADDLTVLDLVASGLDASLTIGSAGSEFNQVTFSGPITLGADEALSVHALGTISLADTTSDLAVSGTGTIALTTAGNIALASGSSITSVAGAITLVASGVGAASFAGIDVAGAIQTATGGISLVGTGGNSGTDNIGVRIVGGSVSATGAGAVALTGVGGSGTDSYGVLLNGTASAAGGDLTITGTRGASSDFGLVTALSASAAISNSGPIVLIANEMSFGASTTFSGGPSSVTLLPSTGGTAIFLGSSADTPDALHLSAAELDLIATSLLQIGDTVSGTITISANIAKPGTNVSLTTGAGVTGSGGLTTGAATATTVTINQAGDSTYSGVLGGAGIDENNFAVVKAGSGALTLSGTNTFDGATTINAGVISISSDANLGTVPGSATPGHLTLNGGALTTTASFTLESNRGVALGGSGGFINVNTGSLAYDGIIAGAGTLTKAQAGSLVLGGTNSYAGATIINAGDINVSSDANLGTVPGSATPGHLTLNGGALTTTATLTLESNRGVALGASGGVINVNSGSLTYGGIIAGSGTLTKAQAGSLVLGGTNAYAGATIINGGDISVSSDANLGTVPGGATPGHLTLNGGALTTTATFTLDSNRGVALDASGGTVNVNSGTTLTYGGIVAGAGALTKDQTGALALTGPNTYAGTTNVSAGVLNIQHATALGTTAGGTTVAAGASLQLQGDIIVADETLSLEGNGVANTGALRSISGSNSWSGDITMGGTTNDMRIHADAGFLTISGDIAGNNSTGDIAIGGAGDGEISGVISGTNDLVKSNLGAWTLSSDNTYTGTTTIGAGTLSVDNIVVSGGSSNLGNAASPVILTGILSYTGNSATYTRGFTLVSGGQLDVTTSGQTLTVDTGDITGSGPLTLGGGGNTTINSVISSTGGLAKTGSGTTILAATNAYIGATTVSAGTLLVNGSTDDGSAFSIEGGTLGGIGTINGPLAMTTAGGVLAPGASPGILTVDDDVTLNSAGSFDVELDGTTVGTEYDQLQVTGTNRTVTLNDATLNVVLGFTPALGNTFIIVNNVDDTSTVSGTFRVDGVSIVDQGTFIVGATTFLIEYHAGIDGNDVVLTVVPPLSLAAAISDGNLTITDTAGSANDFHISLDGGNLVLTDANELFTTASAAATGGTLSNGNKTLTIPNFAGVITGSLTFNGNAGIDTLTLDLASGDVIPPTGLYFHGGDPTTAPGDALIISGGSQGDVTYNFTNASDGNIVMANFGTVHYTGLEPITNTGTANDLEFNLPAGTNAATLGDDGTTSNGLSRLSGATFETTDFTSPAGSLTINRGSANDTLTVNSLPDFNAVLTLGSAGTPFDTINLDGTVALTAGNHLSLFATNVAASASAVVSQASVGTITIVADNVAIDAAATLSAANSTVSLTPLTAGREIDLGTDDVAKLSLTDDELDRITAGTLSIGNASSGTITFSAAINRPADTNVSLTTAANNDIAFGTFSLDAGSGGTVTLTTSGTGAITTGDNTGADLTADTLTLNTGSGGIGTTTDYLRLATSTVVATSTGNGNIHLADAGSEVTIGAAGLNVGSGTITLGGGTFTLGGSNRINDTADVHIADGATLDLGANSETIDQLVLIDGSVTGSGVLTGTSTFDVRKGSISAILAGNVGLTKTTADTVTLSGVNTYSGATTVSEGTLVFADRIVPSTAIDIASGAVLEYDISTGMPEQTTTTITGTGTLRKTGAGALFSGSAGAINWELGSGALIDVQAGLLVGGNFAADVWTANLSDLHIESGAAFAGVEANVRIDALTGGGTLSSGYPGAGYASFTLGVDNGSGTFSGTIIDGAEMVAGVTVADDGAPANIVKTGNGTQTLSGNNTYTGTTTVAAGTLALAHASANNIAASITIDVQADATLDVTGLNSGTLVLASGQTLMGEGSVAGATQATSGATIAPGASPGILATGDVIFDSGSNFNVEINGTDSDQYDQLDVTGSVTLNDGNLNITLGYTPATGDFFTIIHNNDTDAVLGAGTFQVNGATIPDGGAFYIGSTRFVIDYSAGTDDNDVVLTVQNPTATVTLDVSGNLVITDIAVGGQDDTLTISSDTTNDVFVITDPNHILNHTAIPGATVSFDGHTVYVPFDDVTGTHILVNTLAGNDSLTIDFSLGNFSKIITYDGGAETTADSLELTGGTFTTVTHAFTDASSGTIDTGNSQIEYLGLEPVIDNLDATNRVFTFNGGSETITLTTGTTLDNRIDSTLGELVEFNNPTATLTINAGDGDDTVTITSVDSGFNAALTINGGDDNDIVNLDANLTLGSAMSTGDLTVTAETINVASGVALDTIAGVVGGAVVFTAGNNIVLNAGSSITTDDDVITLIANGTAVGSYHGIYVDTATLSAAAGVDITLTGTAGSDGGNGVHLVGAVAFPGASDVAINGTGTTGQADIFWDSLNINKTGGSFTFTNTVAGTTLTTNPDAYTVQLLDGGTITNAVVFNNTSGVILNGTASDLLFNGGVTSTASTTTVQGFIGTSGDALQFADTVLTAATTLDTTNNGGTASGGNITLGATSGTFDLTLTSGTSGTTTLGDSVSVASLMTDAGGTTAINGGSVTTTGNQTYGDPVTLNAAGDSTTLTGVNVSFAGTLRSTVDGQENLTISATGTTTFTGAVGDGGLRLAGLTLDSGGTTAINGGSITTLGGQTFDDAVVLGDNTTLTDNGTVGIALNSTVDGDGNGSWDLTITTTNAAATFQAGGDIGDVEPLDVLTIDNAGVGTIAGILAGTGTTLIKNGVGTLSLTAANTYTGQTTVNAGTLLVNNTAGSGTGTGDVVVATGTLGGTGALSGTVTVNNAGFLSPGTSPGSLTIGNLNLNTGATFVVDLNGPVPVTDYDQLVVTGSVNLNFDGGLGSILDVSRLISFVPVIGSTFTIINNTGGDPILPATPRFQNLDEGDTIEVLGITMSISYVGGTGNDVVLTVEPPTIVYIDDDFGSVSPGFTITDADPVAPGNQAAVMGYSAFTVIQDGVNAVADAGLVVVNPHATAYAENVTISKPLTLNGNGGVSGDVATAVVIEPAAGNAIYVTTGGDNVVIRDLRVTGAVHGIAADGGVADLAIVNVIANLNSGDGIHLDNIGDVSLDFVVADNNTGSGLSMTNSTLSDIVITSVAGASTFDTNGLNGITLDDVADVTFSAISASTNTGSGVDMSSVADVIVSNGSFAGNQAAGLVLVLADSFADTDGSYTGNRDHGIVLSDIVNDAFLTRTTLQDNDADDDDIGDGLHAVDGSDADALAIGGSLIINGVTVSDTDGPAAASQQRHGIYVNGVGEDVIIDGSVDAVQVIGNELAGIHLLNVVRNVQLTEVTSEDNQANDGLFVDTAASVSVVDSSLSGNGTAGAALFSVSGAVTFDNVSAENNTASGLYVNVAASVDVDGGSYSGNSSAGLHVLGITGAITLDNVDVENNDFDGLYVDTAGSVRIADSTLSGNGISGVVLSSITGNVTLIRGNIEDNDADANGSGDGLNATGIGGDLIVEGAVIGNTTPGTGQERGVVVTNLAGNVVFQDSTGVVQSVLVTGNQQDGVRISGDDDGMDTATFTNGTYSGNGGDGIDVDSFQTITLNASGTAANLTASSNTGFGFQVNDFVTLDLADLVLQGNGVNGGTIVAEVGDTTTVNFVTTTTSAGVVDTVVLTATQFQHTRVASVQQPILYANVDALNLFGRDGADVFNIQSTSNVTSTTVDGETGNDVYNVTSDAPTNNGHLDGIAGVLNVADSSGAANRLIISDFAAATQPGTILVTSTSITGFAPAAINYSGIFTNGAANNGILLRGSNAVGDVFEIESTLAGSTIMIEGNDGADTFFVGSTFAADDGDLDGIAGLLTVIGGNPVVATDLDCADDPFTMMPLRDVLYINDRGQIGDVDYTVNFTVANGVTSQFADGSPRIFAGVNFDSTLEYLRLDGTDGVNIFDVRPSASTQFFIDGNLPPPLTPNGDYLRLDTTPGADGTPADRALSITSPGSGHWSFSNRRDLCFESIERFNHVGIVAAGALANKRSQPFVHIYDDETGELRHELVAYELTFRGGVRVATGDVNKDGIPDLVVLPGPGRTALLKIYDGAPDANGVYHFNELTNFEVIPARYNFKRGAYPAIGDVSGDGVNDVLIGADAGWLPVVGVFDGESINVSIDSLPPGTVPAMVLHGTPTLTGDLSNYLLAQEMKFKGGVRVAAGDLNDDGFAEIVVGRGAGKASTVKVFDGADFALRQTITPFGPRHKKGVFVTVGDFDGVGGRDIFVGAGPKWVPQVAVYDVTNGMAYMPPQEKARFLAFEARYRGGVHVSAKPLNGGNPGFLEQVALWTSPASSNLQAIRHATHLDPLNATIVDKVFEEEYFVGGIHVG